MATMLSVKGFICPTPGNEMRGGAFLKRFVDGNELTIWLMTETGVFEPSIKTSVVITSVEVV